MNRPIIIFICLILTIGLGVGFIWPKYQKLQLTKLDIKAREADLQNKKAYYEELAKISEELKKYPEELSKIDSTFSTEISLPSMLNFLQKKASENGLILNQISPSDSIATSKENQRIKEYYLGLSLTGSYSGLKNFLSSLEKSAKIIDVENVSFTSSEKKDSSLSFNLKIKFYSY